MTMMEKESSATTTTTTAVSSPCNDDGNSNNKLPSSPTARAFFAALDEHETVVRVGGGSSTKKQSDFVSKRIRTLGWRNRYSQQEQYPVSISILPRNNNKKSTCDDDDDNHNDQTSISYSFSVRQVQRGEVEGTYGTGATVWPASMVLLKYLERHATSLINNKLVIDLGAGTGITSIGAALLGAKRVICTDGEAPVVQLARDNMAHVVAAGVAAAAATAASDDKKSVEDSTKTSFVLNGCPVEAQEYWWGTGTINGMNEEKDDDDGLVVLVSDCVLPKLYPIAPLVQALDQLLSSRSSSSSSSRSSSSSSMAILSYEHRHYPDYDPRDKFRELASAKNLQVSIISMQQQDPVYSVEDIEIWHVTRLYSKQVDSER